MPHLVGRDLKCVLLEQGDLNFALLDQGGVLIVPYLSREGSQFSLT